MNQTFNSQIANYVGAYQAMEAPEWPKTFPAVTITPVEKQVFEEANEAWKQYSRSRNGRARLRAIANMDLASAQAAVLQMTDEPIWAKLIKLIRKLDLPSGSFSIGLSAEIELILGFKVTLGVAIGIGQNDHLAHSLFIKAGVVEGIEAGDIEGVEFGIWRNSPDDLGGFSLGIELNIGLGAETSTAAWYSSKGKTLGYTLTVGAGADDGIAEIEMYTFVLGSGGDDPFIKPVYQPRKNNFLILESLTCKNPQSGDGGMNEVYFEFQADGSGNVFPYPTYDYFSMGEGDTWACGRSVWFDSYVAITLYDEDVAGSDNIGAFNIPLSDLTLGQTRTYTSSISQGFDDIEYTMDVKLVAQNVGR